MAAAARLPPGGGGRALSLRLRAVAAMLWKPALLLAGLAAAGLALRSGVGRSALDAPALTAQILGCAADFFWVRLVARDWAARRMRGRLARLDAALAKHPFSATFTIRLLPVGSNVALNLLAGVSGVAAAPFLAASVLGYVPQTVVFGLLGAGVSVGRGVQIGLAAGLFAAASGVGVWLMRRRFVGQGSALDPPEDGRPLDTY